MYHRTEAIILIYIIGAVTANMLFMLENRKHLALEGLSGSNLVLKA